MNLSYDDRQGVKILPLPLRPGVVDPRYFDGFNPLEGTTVKSGPIERDTDDLLVESLCEGQWWNVTLLALVRAEWPSVEWRTHWIERVGGAVAFGIVGREVVAIVASYRHQKKEID